MNLGVYFQAGENLSQKPLNLKQIKLLILLIFFYSIEIWIFFGKLMENSRKKEGKSIFFY